MPTPTISEIAKLIRHPRKRYSLNRQRGLEIIAVAVNAYQSRLGPYSRDWKLPEDAAQVLPEKMKLDPVRMARFWFFSCMFMRGRVKSVQAIRRLARLCIEEAAAGNPDILDPFVSQHLDPETVNETLGRYGLSRYGKGWIRNAKLLAEHYGGDPIAIFDGVAESKRPFEVACARICNHRLSAGGGFWGFQKKMASMFTYYLEVAELIAPFPFPPPVDFHHVRVAVITDVVNLKKHILSSRRDLEEGLLEDLRALYMRFWAETGTPTVVTARAMWLLSAYLCTIAPGNQMAKRGKYNARSTELLYKAPDFATATAKEIEAWLLSCGVCPLRSHCSKWMPSGQWYDWGVVGSFVISRTEPPPERLPLFNPYEVVHPMRKTPKHQPRAEPVSPSPETASLF